MSEAQPPPQPARRSRWRTLLRYGVIVLVVVAAGLFLARREIGNVLARKLNERLAAAGIFVAWQSADWVPGPGIQFHDVALFRDATKHERLALLGNVTAIKGDPEWNRWDTVSVSVADARLTLGSGKDEAKLEHLDMQLLIQPGKADLQECHASIQGLRIEAKGTHVRATAPAPASGNVTAKPAAQKGGMFADINLGWLKSVKEWLKFQPEKDEPVLKVEFLPHPDGGGVDLAATLDGRKFQWRGQKWDFIQAAVKTSVGNKDSPLEIEHVRIGHAGQTGEIVGRYEPTRDVLCISKLDSGIDVLALARALVPDAAASLAAVTTTGGWRITGEGEIPVDHPENSRWNGRVELKGDLVYAAEETHVALQKPVFGLRVEEQVLSVSDIKAGLWNGVLDVPMVQVHLLSGKTKPRFEMQITLQQAQLESVISSFGPPQKQPGTLQFDWKGGGEFDPASFTGIGTLSIQDAKLFSIPQQDRLALLGNVTVTRGEAEGNRRDAVSVRVADARLTLGSGEDETKLEDLNMQVRSQPGSAELQEFRARLPGLKIEAKGTHVKTVAAPDSRVEVAHAKTNAPIAAADVAAKPASQGKALFDFNLDWLASVKEWVTMKPEKDDPVLKLEFHPLPDGAGLDLAATLQGRKFSWRGQKWDSVEASVKTSVGKRKSPVQTGQIRLGQGSRTAELDGEFDPAGRVVRIGRIEIGIDLLTVVRTLAPELTPSLTAITSTGACRISGKAEIPLDGSGNSHWYGHVDLGGDLVYASKHVRVEVQKTACNVDLQGSDLAFAGLKGQLWKGNLEMPMLRIRLPSGKKKSRFEMQIALQQAQLESVMSSFGPPQKGPGAVQFDWKGGGEFDLASFAGVGTASIQDAEFLRVPLVGTLGRVFDKLTPGFGRDTSTRMTAAHRTAGGILHLENLIVDSQQTHIDLGGTIDLKRQYAVISGEARMKTIMGRVTSPLGTRTAVKGEGPLDDVQWDTNKKPGTGLIGRTIRAIGSSDGDNNESTSKAAKDQPKNPGK